MQSAIRIIGSLVLLSSAIATYPSSAKLRRDGVLNLYPFPRVGRASSQTWQVPFNDFLLEYKPVEKRQLVAFPRVGRGNAEAVHRDYQPVHIARRSDSTGMWFGPRLGRSFNTDDDADALYRDYQPVHIARRSDSTGMWFGPRLGRSFITDDDDISMLNVNSDRSEPEQIETVPENREKRQIKLM